MERVNDTLMRMESGDPTFGAWVSSMSPRSAEVLGVNGLDWSVIDMEHSPVGLPRSENLIRAVEHYGMTPLVRVPEPDSGLKGVSKRVLDSGAMGIIVPRVESGDQAERILDAALYPPKGDRGAVGSSRANDYGTNFDEYVGRANDELMLCVQLETVAGADHAEEILSVDGINCVFIGENDLSTSHGVPGRKDHDDVQADVERILQTATENDVHAGIVAPTPERIEKRIADGFDFISIGSDLSFMHRSIGQLLPE